MDRTNTFSLGSVIITLGIAGFGLLALYVTYLTVRFLIHEGKKSWAAKKEAAANALSMEKKEGKALLGAALGPASLYGVMALGFLFIASVLLLGGMGLSFTEVLSRVLIWAGLGGASLLFLYVAYLLTAMLWRALKPAKPGAVAKSTPSVELPAPTITRRSFLSLLGWAWVAFTAASMGALSTVLRFFFPNVTFEPPLKFKAGFPDTYKMGVDERFKASNRVWIVRNAQGFYSLSTICTHLGCTPNWMQAAQKFKCPCHGSGFYITGINFEGPAPRPLPRYNMGWADDGQIQVDMGIQYQYELGQWGLPGSFLDYKKA